MRARRCGANRTRILARFDERVVDKALTHKRSHPRWGADRVLVELRKDSQLAGLKLPGRSRLAAFFNACCPECVGSRQPRRPALARPPRVTGVHELWQLDTQSGENRPSLAQLTFEKVLSVLRAGFSEWQALPNGVQTDNELVLR